MATLSLIEIPEFEQNSKLTIRPFMENIVFGYNFKMTVISLNVVTLEIKYENEKKSKTEIKSL